MRTAHVYFWDGYRFGPMVMTTSEDLEDRIQEVIEHSSPGVATAFFAGIGLAKNISTSLWNAPPGRTTAAIYAAALDEANWPEMRHQKDWQAGVFVVNLVTGECAISGGLGFYHTIDETNPRQVRIVHIESPNAGEPEEL